MLKIETYLPKKALKKVQQALACLGVGKIGNYDLCMSWSKVKSCWRANNNAKPFWGKVGKLTTAKEIKLEFRCKESELKKVIKTIKDNHPYEEVCINVFELD